jgi:hypothetical protein
MSYVELEEVALDKKLTDKERLAKRYREITEEELNEMHKDKTTYIDDDHPLWIAAEKALKDYEEGKLLSTKQIIEMIKNGEYDFED